MIDSKNIVITDRTKNPLATPVVIVNGDKTIDAQPVIVVKDETGGGGLPDVVEQIAITRFDLESDGHGPYTFPHGLSVIPDYLVVNKLDNEPITYRIAGFGRASRYPYYRGSTLKSYGYSLEYSSSVLKPPSYGLDVISDLNERDFTFMNNPSVAVLFGSGYYEVIAIKFKDENS